VLEEHTPDLMLLDIEMPRMDGFEVATHVRDDPRLKRLPIIMITSRTGQKHRDRAMAIGVNDYLGKPYQESVLLDSIAHWSSPMLTTAPANSPACCCPWPTATWCCPTSPSPS
jgi:chemosensory pili system protein ChpA (sensor histidine kinase/response regulator)